MDREAAQLTFEQLHRQIDDAVGVILFTVLDWHEDDQTFLRLSSNRADLSKPGVVKDGSVSSAWFEHCIRNHKPFLGPDPQTIRDTYGEWEPLLSAGCGSSINVPVTDSDGATIGVLNVFAEEGRYTRDSVIRIERLVAHHGEELTDLVRRASGHLRRSPANE